MELRSTVHLPQRLNSDLFYTPLSKRPLRENREESSLRHIDFNPNLPPAAFPTLERPRASESSHQQLEQAQVDRYTTRNKQRRSNNNQNNSCAKTQTQRESKLDLDEIPMDLIENYAANNADSNSIYVIKTAGMAATPHKDMEDSDPEEVMVKSHHLQLGESTSIRNPNWNNLSERMQVEIFDNILECHSWPSACHMLGLTTEEREAIQGLLRARMEQIHLEDSQLKAMRAKQLRALLKVDNSSWKCTRVPHQLVFRKISRQFAHKLKEAVKTDYLLCEAQELLSARRFLRRRGIDIKFAGNWSNNMDLVQTDEYSVSEANPRDSDLDENLSLVMLSPTFSVKEQLINSIAEETTASTRDLLQRRGDLNAPPRWMTLLHRGWMEPAWQVHAQCSTEHVTKVGEAEKQYIQPQKMHWMLPPIDCFYLDESFGTGQLNRSSAANPSPYPPTSISKSQQHSQVTKERSLPRESGSADWTSRHISPTELHERIEEARQYARRPNHRRATFNNDDTHDIYADLTCLPRTPIAASRSPSTTPGRILSPTVSEIALFAFSNPGTPLTIGDHDALPPSAPVLESVLRSPKNVRVESAGGNPSTPMAVQHSPEITYDDKNTENCDEDKDDDYEEDEMVLIPCGARTSQRA
ncbi:hypothetical protein AOCH_006124 [Aspergillus ochraceoroseus]|uniref:Uncharacterized protein n=1 Tax=Aspergillus ochraceoroseus TaxID=138278 RepID=A0A0F8TYI2_9EURO|nr:hypothetical protein AOCH_006124 [Aspergillus ochraceoroseus]